MKLRFVATALLLMLAAGSAPAHGNKVHVYGTLEKINTDSVVVKTKDGKSLEVKLVASTIFVERSNNQDKPAKLSDLAVGDIVFVHATPKGSTLEADQIKFSLATAPKAAATAAPKPKS